VAADSEDARREEQGKRRLHVTFQNTADQLIGAAAEFGWDLTSADAAKGYIEDGSRVGRAVHVAKMRSSWHEMTLNSVRISDRGLVVGDELESVTGRLGWSALRTHGPLESVRPVGHDPAGSR
jgi:KaiC/GvpD/RAD55 family RecA-like ATPase